MTKPLMMKIEREQHYVTITFSGSLEYGKLEEVKKELQLTSFAEHLHYIIDMRETEHVDSTGFGMIVNFAKKVAVKGKKIAIIVDDAFVRNLFTISQCDKIFPIVATEKEAIDILKGDWQAEMSINDY